MYAPTKHLVLLSLCVVSSFADYRGALNKDVQPIITPLAEEVKPTQPTQESDASPPKELTDQKQLEKDEATPVDYTGAQLWTVQITSSPQLELIGRLSHVGAFSVWGGNRTRVDVLVLKDKVDDIGKVFEQHHIPYKVQMEDLQSAIRSANPPLEDEAMQLQNRKGHRMTWQQYHRLADIHGFLDYLATTYPKICSVFSIGKSHQGRDLKLIKISNGNPGNKAIFIDGGIHAREWISPATVTYFINHLAENFDVETSDMHNIDWYIVPVLNPDGYEFTHTVDRLWRKNRRSSGVCAGVDLNRNFGYHWGGKGTSKYPCSEVYAGSKAFSEPESAALSNYIMNSKADFRAYLTYHSYGQFLLHPWGYDALVPPDHEDLTRVGNEMAKAIEAKGGSKYTVGASSIVLYAAAGGSDDWAKAVANIKYSFTVELSDTGKHGFVLPASYIIPVAQESLEGVRVIAKAVMSER